jgi:PKD repeat protein
LNDIAGGNGNGIMETAETILASLTIKNVGNGNASNISVTIETLDEYVTLTDDTEVYGTILAGATAVVLDGFGWEVADNIPDLHTVIFEITSTDGNETWTSFFGVEGHGPLIELGNKQIDDAQGNGNGRLDSGEIIDFIIPTFNNGSYQANDAVGTLSCSSPFITLNNPTFNFNDIGAGLMEEAIFSITVSPNAPIGTGVSFIYNVTSGGYSIQESYTAAIGLILEDWETGDMSMFEWMTGGSSNWAVTNTNTYEGSFCIKSGTLSDNQSNYLSLQYEVYAADSISFWYKVSSESNYDYLKFYIDNEQKGSWSGEVAWSWGTYLVSPGLHTFKWAYSKDVSIGYGSDCSWVDFIVLPASAYQVSFTSNVTEVCENNTVNFFDQSSGNIISWAWIFEGGTPSISSEQNPTVLYTTAGSYTVLLTVSDGIEDKTLVINDYITVLTIPVTPPAPSGPTSVCGNEGNSSYTTGLTGVTIYNWLLDPANAGNIEGTGPTATVIWENEFLGEATLKVAGENNCGTGTYSNPINITRYLPVVTLEPFDWVCVEWPAMELTGGMPDGGEYSGPGVENGWFDPAAAGAGTHTITYTYADAENCENSATETILVDPCTGLSDLSDQSGIMIYPNPTTGLITVGFDRNYGIIEVSVVNILNQVEYSGSIETMAGNKMNIDLSKLVKGVYFITLKTETRIETVKIILE